MYILVASTALRVNVTEVELVAVAPLLIEMLGVVGAELSSKICPIGLQLTIDRETPIAATHLINLNCFITVFS